MSNGKLRLQEWEETDERGAHMKHRASFDDTICVHTQLSEPALGSDWSATGQ